MAVVTGRIQKVPCEIKEIEWKIDDYFTVTKERDWYKSPIFSFADANTTWHLEHFPRQTQLNEKFVGLYLYRNVKLEYEVEYTYGLRKRDGNVEKLFRGILQKGSIGTNSVDLIKKEELLHRESELVPDNTLTILCTMKFMTEITHSPQKTGLDEIRISKLTRLDKLSDNFKDFFADKETCDVTLRVQDKEYKAHRSVLIARSRVFAANFKHDTLEKQTGVVTISDCDPDSFQKFLEYLYGGELEQLCFRSALTLYYTSDKYDVEEVKEFCVEYLIQHLTVENVCDIAVFADKYDEEKLFSGAQDFFNGNARKIFMTPEWESFFKKDHRLANKLLIEMSKVKFGD